MIPGSSENGIPYGLALLPNGEAVYGSEYGTVGNTLEYALTFSNAPNTSVSTVGPYDGFLDAQPTVDSAGNIYFEVGGTLYSVTETGAARWSAGTGSVTVGIAMGADGSLYYGSAPGNSGGSVLGAFGP